MMKHIPRQILTTESVDSLLGYECYGHLSLVPDAAVIRDRLLDIFGDKIPPIQQWLTTAPVGSDLAEWFRWACPYNYIRLDESDVDMHSVVYTLTSFETQNVIQARRYHAQSHHSHLVLRCQILCLLSAYELLPPCYPT